MLRRTNVTFASKVSYMETPPNYIRVNTRREKLERRRIAEAQWMPKAIEPTPDQARELYRRMLKEGYKTLQLTDKEYYKAKLRFEFEVTARQTSSRVRGLMYEKGQWMLKNKLGGLQ